MFEVLICFRNKFFINFEDCVVVLKHVLTIERYISLDIYSRRGCVWCLLIECPLFSTKR